MIKSETITKIAPAMTKAWSEIENPKHNKSVTVQTKKGSKYTFDYTDLNAIFDEAKRVYRDNGIMITQNAYTEDTEGRFIILVDTMLLHSSGEWMKSNPLKMPANSSIQDMGGQITYLKRYSLSAMLGIATEKDDDANGASGNEYEMNQVKRRSSPNKKTTNGPSKAVIQAKFKTGGGTDEQFNEWYAKQLSVGVTNLKMDEYLTKKLTEKQEG